MTKIDFRFLEILTALTLNRYIQIFILTIPTIKRKFHLSPKTYLLILEFSKNFFHFFSIKQ